jgi:translation initiation factor 1 (eIF-1/SUI1)
LVLTIVTPEIDEKKFCKPLGKKFATGASFTKGEGIIMQGDLADKMTEFMLESFPGQVWYMLTHRSMPMISRS